MGQPQQPEQRRSDRGGATQDSAKGVARSGRKVGKGHPHGTDKGNRGGGRGGGVPPEQRPQHPY
jgi:hypothetical protein